MKIRTLLLLLILATVAVFTLLNWTAFMAPTALTLGVMDVQAPLGLVMLGVVVVAVIRMVRRSRAGANGNGGLEYQGAAGQAGAVTPPQYNPTKVGNDASARPWESQAAQFDGGAAQGGSIIGSGSVVTSASPAGVIAAGVPCKVIRTISEQDKTGFDPRTMLNGPSCS